MINEIQENLYSLLPQENNKYKLVKQYLKMFIRLYNLKPLHGMTLIYIRKKKHLP